MTVRLSEHEVARRVEAARTALAEAWLFPEGLALAARALAALAPGHSGMIYFREPDGAFSEVGLDAHGKLATAWNQFPFPNTLEVLKQCLSYPLTGPDPHAGKVVVAESTFADEERQAKYLALLHANGFVGTLRVLLRRRGRMRAWCGMFQQHGDRPAGTDVAAHLSRVVPAVRDAARAAEITRYGQADPGTVQVLFESIDQPIWLVTRCGTIAYANQIARGLGREAAAVVRRAAHGSGDPRVSVSRVSLGGDTLALVVGRAPAAIGLSLPPSLVRVAQGVANGWSDKQIAEELAMSLATVRTYVRRCYERLGVHNRVELAEKVGRGPATFPRDR